MCKCMIYVAGFSFTFFALQFGSFEYTRKVLFDLEDQ